MHDSISIISENAMELHELYMKIYSNAAIYCVSYQQHLLHTEVRGI